MCIEELTNVIQEGFNQCPEICPFSAKQDAQDRIDEILEKARNTDTYSNEEIKRVQGLIEDEVKVQKDQKKNPGNFESYTVMEPDKKWVKESVEVSVPVYSQTWVDYDAIDGTPAHEENYPEIVTFLKG